MAATLSMGGTIVPITSFEQFRQIMQQGVHFANEKESAEISTRKQIRHLSISICSCISAMAVQQIYGFIDKLRKTSRKEFREKNGFVHDFGSDGTLKSMYNKMEKLLNEWSVKLDAVCKSVKDVQDYSERFSDTLDYAEETVNPIVAALRRYVDRKEREQSDSMPVDVNMLTELSMSIYMCDLSRHFFDTMTTPRNFPNLKDNKDYNFLSLEKVWVQLMKIQSFLDFRDTNSKDLKFSIYNMLTSEPVVEITDDLMYLLYSSEFLDELYFRQCHIDMELRNSNMKSLIDSFESKTRTVRGTRNKYRKMYM